MQTKPKTSVKLFILTALLLSIWGIGVHCKTEKLTLYSPTNGITIANNVPTLSWSSMQCNYYKVFIDNILVDSLKSSINYCAPFPLSFGKHNWQVIAYTSNGEIKSENGTFTIDDKPLQTLPEGSLLLRNNWKVQNSFVVKENGASLSTEKGSDKGWYTTSLPATALTALVRNGVYPNPYVGMNNMKIPDSDDKYNQTYSLLKYSHIPNRNPWRDAYWYRTEFETPKDFSGKIIWLNFNEINYRAEVWLNGKQIADTAKMVGMERKFRFDISSLLKKEGKNYLAVAIYPVDVPGEPANEPLTPLGDPGQNMGNGMISKSYTKWDAMGWDWQPPIRDRDMGITEDVYLSTTNSIEIDNLYVTSDLQVPDTTKASVTISADVVNHSDKEQKGKLKATISIQNQIVPIEDEFTVAANSSQSIVWDSKKFSQLSLKNPLLWWPAGYGQQNLYKLKIDAQTSSNETASIQTNFGIRKLETYIGAKERVFKINGQEIYCKGGNWVIDMTLNWTAKRYEDEIMLSKNAGLNILRIWGPTGVPPQAFYEAADKHGIMLWQDFLNDFWGTFKNTAGYTTPNAVYEAATIEIVKKYRNHPSLIMWCGGNEGPNPREKWITSQVLPKYDGRDSKHYLKQSDGDGLHGGGPYHTLEPKEYFSHKKLNGFSSEIGPSGIPVYESVLKFMHNPGTGYLPERFPLDANWAYHDANDWPGNDTRKFSSYDNILLNQYGRPTKTDESGVIEYLNKTQLINYEVYRASFESINRQLWTSASGMLLWKSNSSWTSMVWQLYDWYLQAHAGFYATKSACEALHIQMNRDKYDVVVLNAQHKEVKNVKISATLYNQKLEKLWEKQQTASLPKNAVFASGWTVPVTNDLCFLKLKVENEKNEILSENFYWLSVKDNYKALSELAPANISATAIKISGNGKTKYRLTVTNKGTGLAFMVAFKLQGEKSGLELLPSFWTKNYVNLLPNESISSEVEINDLDIVEKPVLSCKAYNMEKAIISEIK